MILSYFAGDPIAAFGVVKASSLTCKDWRFLVHWDHVPALWFPREVQQRLLGIGGYAIPRPQSCSSTRAPTFNTRGACTLFVQPVCVDLVVDLSTPFIAPSSVAPSETE